MRRKIGHGGGVVLFAWLAGSAATLASAAALMSAAETPAAFATVTVDTGKLRGEAQGEVVSFKGIPFAQPPVGELRWKPPQPVAKWQGVRDAAGDGAESLRQQSPGAMHATDIPFAFDTVAARYGKDLTAQDAAAAHSMHAYWVAFAATGKPEVAGQPAWPVYDAKSDLIMDFTNTGPVAASDPWRARLDLAEAFNLAHESGAPAAGAR
jgi:carboxylesterase type B